MPNDLHVRRLDAVLEFVSACTPLRTRDALFRVLADRSHELLDFERLGILLCDGNCQTLRTIMIKDCAWREISADEIEPSEMDLIVQGLLTRAESRSSAGRCAPMESEGHLIGALFLPSRGEEYTDQDVRVIQFLVAYLAAAFARLAQGSVVADALAPTESVADTHEASSTPTPARSLRLSHLAHHDALTNLPNRLLLNDRLARALALSSRYRRELAVLFMDLDGFKEINDTRGHAVGDQVLCQIADRLARCVRSSDTVSRIGGDEFVVLLAELKRPEDAAVSAGKIIAAISAPLHVGGHEVHLTLSIGVAVYPGDGEDAEALIKNADTAMYHSKADGPGKCQFFREEMNILTLERQILTEGLRQALDRQELVLNYQPRVDLETGTVIGSEALIRWLHPDRGLLLPAQFLPIAEHSGLIVPIGRWALSATCQQAQAWQDAGLPPLPVSVNFSWPELQRNDFLENVRNVLEQSRLQARYLDVELREGVVMQEKGPSCAILQSLKAMNIRVTLDHFGLGCSSLNYLAQLPMDAFKVDSSFIQQLTPDSNWTFREGAGHTISAVIGLGKSLGHRVIVEGVDTAEQVAFLRGQHCREAQGNYFSPPLSAQQFADTLKKGGVLPRTFERYGRRAPDKILRPNQQNDLKSG